MLRATFTFSSEEQADLGGPAHRLRRERPGARDEIGPFLEDDSPGTLLDAPGCAEVEADAGVHVAISPDGGSSSSAGEALECVPKYSEIRSTVCPETRAAGAARLGLPSRVTVLGERDFELHGELGERLLDCSRERFGAEKLLFCRERGELVCVAVLESI